MRVLVIAHGFPPSGTGGAELYAQAMARRIAARGDDVVVLAREHDPSADEFRVREDRSGPLRVYWINNTFRTTRDFSETYRQPAIDRAAAAVIDRVRPAVAHVHHLTGLSTTILDELARRKIPVVLTLHDYWMICHRGQLFDEDMRRCAGPGEHGCARCTGIAGRAPAAFAGARLIRALDRHAPSAARGLRTAAGSLVSGTSNETRGRSASLGRLMHMRERFAYVDVALAPSDHVRRRFEQAGFPAGKIRVSGYGVDPVQHAATVSHGSLRLGYLGTLIASKAPHLLADAVCALPAGAVNAHFFGAPAPFHGDPGYSDTIASRLSGPGVVVHGAVPHDRVGGVFAAIDALVFPSLWEETSGIGARESLSAGVPVIASRIGGIPETVHHGINGLLFTPGDVVDLTRQIRRLLDEPGLLPQLRRGCAVPRTLDDDVAATRAIYEELASARRGRQFGMRDRVGGRVVAVVVNYGTHEQTALTAELLLRSNAPLDVVVVDNGDGSGCRRALGQLSDRLTLHATGSNLGFAGGCNAGIAIALQGGADAVWLINSDLLVPPDCLERLLAALDARSDLAIVSPLVRSRGWPRRVLSAGLAYDARSGRMTERRDAGVAAIDAAPAVSGCAMLVRRTAFERVGLLPDEYFFGFEDVAFCQQVRQAGLGVAVVTDAAVYHEGSGTMGAHADRLYYAARNHLRLGADTPAVSRLHRWTRQAAIAGYNLAHVLTSRDATVAARFTAVAHGIIDHVRGRYGARRP